MKDFHIRVPARASIWYIASALIGRGVGFLFTPIFTRILTPEQYGTYTLYLSWLGIFTIISTLEISGGIYMRALQKSDDKDRLFRSACVLETLLSIAFCTLYFAFYPSLSKITQLSSTISLLAFVQIFLSSIINLYLATAKFYYRYREVFVLNVAIGALPVPIALVALRISALGAYGRIIGSILTSAAAAIYIIYIMSRGKKGISFADMRTLFLNGCAHLPHFLSLSLVGRVDKLAVSGAFGAVALARYAVADNVGSLLIFATTAPLSALTPWLLRRLSAGEYDRIRETGSLGARLILWVSLILLSYSPEILGFLAPAAYSEALFAAYPIALAAIPAFLFAVSATAMMHGRTGIVSVIPSVLGALTAFGGAYLLSRFPHFTAIAFIQPTAQLVMLAAACAVLSRRQVHVVDIKNTLTMLAIGAIGAVALFLIRDFLLLRVILSAVCAVPLIFELGRSAVLVKEEPGAL